MKQSLAKAREAYYAASGSASTAGRQAALAGIAIVWLFSTKTAQGYTLPHDLLWVLLVFVLVLLADLLHYLVQAATWGIWARLKENTLPDSFDKDEGDAKFYAKEWLNWPINVFYYGKFALLLSGYALLTRFLIHALAFTPDAS